MEHSSVSGICLIAGLTCGDDPTEDTSLEQLNNQAFVVLT